MSNDMIVDDAQIGRNSRIDKAHALYWIAPGLGQLRRKAHGRKPDKSVYCQQPSTGRR